MFKKGSYIVNLKDNHLYQFSINFVYKQKIDADHLITEKDDRGSGSNGIESFKYSDFSKWRYATTEEIDYYNSINTPYSINILKQEKNNMEKLILDVLNKTYNNTFLRQRTVPLFMSNPGVGKSTIIRNFAKEKRVNMLKLTLSQRMPNEVAGMTI